MSNAERRPVCPSIIATAMARLLAGAERALFRTELAVFTAVLDPNLQIAQHPAQDAHDLLIGAQYQRLQTHRRSSFRGRNVSSRRFQLCEALSSSSSVFRRCATLRSCSAAVWRASICLPS